MKQPPEPTRLTYLFRIFNMAGRGRPLSPGGWMPLPISEIDATARLLSIRLRPWEIDGLLRLDDAWRKVMSEQGHSFEDGDDVR